jgi:hypothetical protein
MTKDVVGKVSGARGEIGRVGDGDKLPVEVVGKLQRASYSNSPM